MIRKSKIDIFDMLLTRMDWPIGSTRIASARRIAELLMNDSKGARKRLFLEWLANRETEIEVVKELVVISLASKSQIFDPKEIVLATKCPSILFDIYFQEIFDQLPENISWENATSGPVPNDWKVDDDFENMVLTFVAPIFRDRIEQLSRITGRPFWRQWIWEYHQLSKDICRHSPTPRYFSNDHQNPIIGDLEVRQGEVVKSAFLRSLHYAVKGWGMPIPLAQNVALMCAPAHLGLSKIEPSSIPIWWPNLVDDEAVDLAAKFEGSEDLLNSLLDLTKDKVILAAEGHVYFSDKRWLEIEFKSGLCTEETVQDPNEFLLTLGKWICKSPSLLLPDEISNSQVQYLGENETNVYPLAIKVFPNEWPRSHINIISRGVFVPAPYIFGGSVEVNIQSDGIVYSLDGKPFAKWIYWFAPWISTHPQTTGGAIGTALIMNDNALLSQVETRHGKIHMGYRLERSFRKENYDKWESDSISGMKKIF